MQLLDQVGLSTRIDGYYNNEAPERSNIPAAWHSQRGYLSSLGRIKQGVQAQQGLKNWKAMHHLSMVKVVIEDDLNILYGSVPC